MTEDEMVGWYHRLHGHEFEQALGVSEGQEAWRAAVHGVAKSQFFASGGQSIGASASTSVLPMNIQD